MNRYHIQRDDSRTTVTLDSTICELLALKLGIFPDTKDSHKEVRQWLQNTCDKEKNSPTSNLSQWLKRKAILHIADNKLLTKHNEWQKEIDQSWTEELTKRVDDVDSGKVIMRSRDEVMIRAREQLV